MNDARNSGDDLHRSVVPTVIGERVTEEVGAVIGSYKLMEQIGEGGFGVVFVAEQLKPVKRRVAVKLIKPGMDTRDVIARFEAERQALAMMDHPNIARVLDAGATDSGRPFFVMELVRGVPITDYCDESHFTLRERLELFVSVCQAVQHAHQKGIIHRDLKPSNVLVTLQDGRPMVKVIDFGVAKALHQQLTDKTIYTRFAQVVGTPLYMSPEQAMMSGLDIDTRSDIYSLGVVLYELLTGMTPIDKRRLAQAAYDEIRRLIREEEPPKPSTRLSTTESIASIAAQRRTEPAKLSKSIRGDLDWITMKALEKDRSRRYETANGLARDIQRYLADEVVEARSPSTGYRLHKFARKHRAALSTSVAIALLLVAGVVVSTWEAVRAMRAEQAAQRSAAEALAAQKAEAEQRRLAEAAALAEKSAKETAEAREAETSAVLDFVNNKILAAARPKKQEGGLGHDVKLSDAIRAALPFVEKGFPKQPLVEARLRMAMGNSFWLLGDARAAGEQFVVARALYVKHRGPDHIDTLKIANNLGNAYAAVGLNTEAINLLAETLALRRAKLGPDDPDTLRSMNNLAVAYAGAGRIPEALQRFEEAFRLQRVKLGADHPLTLTCMNNVASCYLELGRVEEALKMFEETLQLQKAKLGPSHLETLRTMNNLAETLVAAGRSAEAVPLYEETIRLKKAQIGPDHLETLGSVRNLAVAYLDVGRTADALKVFEKTLEREKAKIGADHPETLMTMRGLARCYAAASRAPEALRLREETLRRRKDKLGADHPDTIESMNDLAAAYAEAGRHAEALKLCRETIAAWEKLTRTDPFALYNAACFRAATAAVQRAADKSPDGAKQANAEADRAMNLLKQAVAAGWKGGIQMQKNDDLKALRDRPDFKKLLAELMGK